MSDPEEFCGKSEEPSDIGEIVFSVNRHGRIDRNITNLTLNAIIDQNRGHARSHEGLSNNISVNFNGKPENSSIDVRAARNFVSASSSTKGKFTTVSGSSTDVEVNSNGLTSFVEGGSHNIFTEGSGDISSVRGYSITTDFNNNQVGDVVFYHGAGTSVNPINGKCVGLLIENLPATVDETQQFAILSTSSASSSLGGLLHLDTLAPNSIVHTDANSNLISVPPGFRTYRTICSGAGTWKVCIKDMNLVNPPSFCFTQPYSITRNAVNVVISEKTNTFISGFITSASPVAGTEIDILIFV